MTLVSLVSLRGDTSPSVLTFSVCDQSGGRAKAVNKRYRRYYDKLLDRWIEDLVMREEPIMLTEAELDLPSNPPHDFSERRRVYVWVRYPSSAYRVQAHAIAWTKTAVKVSFFEPGIKIQREGWVWVGSVTPAAPDEN